MRATNYTDTSINNSAAKVNEESELNSLSLTALTHNISTTNHEYLKKALPVILSYLQNALATQGDRFPELKKIYPQFISLKEEIEMHIQKEELIVFPRIREVEKYKNQKTAKVVFNSSFLPAPASLMEQEHHQIEKTLETIANLSNNYTAPAGACTSLQLTFAYLETFDKNLKRHIAIENNILFPKAIALFNSCQGKI